MGYGISHFLGMLFCVYCGDDVLLLLLCSFFPPSLPLSLVLSAVGVTNRLCGMAGLQ